MTQKRLIYPEKVRRVPEQFSWIDHRLVRDRHLENLSHAAAALYLMLVTVGDRQGLSYYSDRAVGDLLTMDLPLVGKSRGQLIQSGLLAYQKPFYQVLSLEPVRPVRKTSGDLMPVAAILQQMAGGRS